MAFEVVLCLLTHSQCYALNNSVWHDIIILFLRIAVRVVGARLGGLPRSSLVRYTMASKL